MENNVITYILKNSGLKINEIAKMLGVSRTTIVMWENGLKTSPAKQEKVQLLYKEVLLHDTPSGSRKHIMGARAGQGSIYDQFRRKESSTGDEPNRSASPLSLQPSRGEHNV